MSHLGKVVCKACWKKETANKGGICTGCLNRGLSAQPRPMRKVKPDVPDDEPVLLEDEEPYDESDDYREYEYP